MSHLPIVDGTVTSTRRSAAGAPADSSLPDLREDDLHDLLVAFYDTVGADEMLASYFAPIDMHEHIPRIADFWSTIVFGTRRYAGNAFRPHAAMPGLTAVHFVRWLDTLEATIEARFAGPNAEQMKAMAHRIAFSMQIRLGIAPFETEPA